MIPELKEQYEDDGTYVRCVVKWLKDEGFIKSLTGSITRLVPLNEAEDSDALAVVP